MKTSRPMMAILVLQGLALLALWSSRSMPQAAAQLPDPAAQRDKQIDALHELSAKVDKLTELLASGKVQVKVIPAEEK
jgi:hypothetical protein